MSDFKCPFCGSDKLKLETPYVKTTYVWGANGKEEKTEAETRFCCQAQAQNHEFVKKNFDPDHQPTQEEVAKW